MSNAMMAYAPESQGVVMRHDPASAAVVIMLRSLKMYGMAQAVEDLIEQGAPAFEAAIPILSQLLKAELAERKVRSIAYHMKAARFPAYKDLAGFDFAADFDDIVGITVVIQQGGNAVNGIAFGQG